MWRCKPFCNWPEWNVSLKRPVDSGRDGNKRTEGYEDVPLYTAPTPQPEQPVAVFDEKLGRPRLIEGAPMLKDGQALYTAPAPRQWVSLTEQEMYDLFFNDQYGPRLPEYLVNTIKCVEAALKEKNT